MNRMRNFFSAIAACTLLTACSTSGDEPQPAPEAIRFDGNLGTASRAGDADLPELNSFDVWATMHDPADAANITTIFDATTVSWKDNGSWFYDGEDRYWYPGMAYNFRAISPAGTEGVTFTSADGEGAALRIDGYTPQKHIALRAATDRRECPINSANSTSAQLPVKLSFYNLLSRISFRGRSDEASLGEGRRVIVDAAAVYGIAERGSWDGAGFNPEAGALGTWTVEEPAGSSAEPLFRVEYPDGLELSPDGTDIFAGADIITVLPQTVTAAARFELTFHYNVNDAHQFTYSAPLTTADIVTTWSAGHSYRYPFTVNTNIFLSVPQVAPWGEISVDDPDNFVIK